MDSTEPRTTPRSGSSATGDEEEQWEGSVCRGRKEVVTSVGGGWAAFTGTGERQVTGLGKVRKKSDSLEMEMILKTNIYFKFYA